MESLLKGISGVIVYIDDIMVTGSTPQEHLHALDEVLTRLEKAGLKAKMKKWRFMQPSVTYLGYRIDAEGIHPIAKKVKTIQEAPAPCDMKELKSYLNLLQ